MHLRYPMGLPPYDEVEHILNDTEDLTGRQAALQHIEEDMGELFDQFMGPEGDDRSGRPVGRGMPYTRDDGLYDM